MANAPDLADARAGKILFEKREPLRLRRGTATGRQSNGCGVLLSDVYAPWSSLTKPKVAHITQ